MTTQPTTTPDNTKRNRIFFYLVSLLLIVKFVWRMIVVADEYPMRTGQVMDMVVDAALIVALIIGRKSGPQLLFIVALIAGLGLFGIRMHSDASWWTGHWHYALDRR